MTQFLGAPTEIHLFEPSGYGGVFQHACRLAEALDSRQLNVVLHTGHQHEDVHLRGVTLCPCSWWPRSLTHDRLRSGARRATIAARLVVRTVPHLLRSAPAGAVVHVQGTAASGALNGLAMACARRTGHRVVYSPHDTFSRRGRLDAVALRLAYRAPHAIIVHSCADRKYLQRIGIQADFSPLIQLVPEPSDFDQMRWRREWRARESDSVVLFAGFIRPEKRLDLLIESACHWVAQRRLAVLGPDRGGWDACARLAERRNVDIAARLEFVQLHDFASAIAAADLVVVPSDRASQSGVLALARQLRTPTVAADVGGMAELASRTFAAGDAQDLGRAIDAELGHAAAVTPLRDEDEAITAHLHAYGRRHDQT